MENEITEEVILPEDPEKKVIDLKSPAARWAGDLHRVMGERPKPFQGAHGKMEVTEQGNLDLRNLDYLLAEEIPRFIEYLQTTFGIE